MKYSLLFTDIIATIAGLAGLTATALMVQSLMDPERAGAPDSFANVALMVVVLLFVSRKFVVNAPFDRMVRRARGFIGRVIFFAWSSVWLFLILLMFLASEPDDLFGAGAYFALPGFLAVFAVFVFCFWLVFVVPGFAYRHIDDPVQAHPDTSRNASEAQSVAPQKSPGFFNASANMARSKASVPVAPSRMRTLLTKVSGCFLAVLMFGTGYFFFFERTIASPAYLDAATPLFFLLAIPIFIGMYLPYNYGERILPETGEPLFTPARKAINGVGTLGMSIGFAVIATWFLVPGAYNRIAATENASQAYVVVEPVSYKSCRRGIKLHHPGRPDRTFDLCRLSEAQKNELVPGMMLSISGAQSKFGHTVEQIRVARKLPAV